jgi:hypothetical protein
MPDNNYPFFSTKCGSIREVKITQLPGSFVATVEFFERVGQLCG